MVLLDSVSSLASSTALVCEKAARQCALLSSMKFHEMYHRAALLMAAWKVCEMNPHEPRQNQPRSHLFTVRLWHEEVGDAAYEVRMQVKHILSGRTRYFREWSDFVAYLQHVAREADQAEQADR